MMTMEFSTLLSPVKIGKLALKNRFVVPPMGTNYANSDGTVSQRLIDYLTARARGGFGLIIVEVSAIDPLGKAISNEVGIWDDRHILGLSILAAAVHDAGAKIIIQLHHCGRQTVPAFIGGQQPVAPSAVACPLMDSIPRELTTQETWDLVEKFGDAAVRAQKAGFDGVEIHGAHGYIIAQYMSPHANKRFDEFGGDFMGRMKFPLEIFKNVRKKCGDDFVMNFRYSYDEKVNGGRTLEESTAIARLAEEAGVDALHISIMTYASLQWMSAPAAIPPGFNQYPTEQIKKAVNIPVIAVGRYNNMYVAEDMLRSKRADLVSLGRESIADPEIPRKVQEGRIDEISPCIGCLQSCLGYLFDPTKNKVACLVNPVTGHEGEYDLGEAAQKKNVMIIGSGPAGLEAAWVAAKKGHKVTVYEKEQVMGGQFRVAAIPPTKHEILSMLKYYVTMGRKYGVTYKLNTEVTEELVLAEKPDAVILATGGVPLKPAIEGIDNEKFVTVADILEGTAVAGKKVLVVGGGMAGAETADFLGEHGRDVTIIEMNPVIAQDVESTVRVFLMERLASHVVKQMTDAKVTRFLADGVSFMRDGSEQCINGFDTIVLAMGAKSYNPLEGKLQGKVRELYVIGDAKTAGKANCATEAGLAAALSL